MRPGWNGSSSNARPVRTVAEVARWVVVPSWIVVHDGSQRVGVERHLGAASARSPGDPPHVRLGSLEVCPRRSPDPTASTRSPSVITDPSTMMVMGA